MSNLVLSAETLSSLTPTQRRVWCALVVREKAIAWGGEALRFASREDLSVAASVNIKTVRKALDRMEKLGVLTVRPRFAPPGWDGDEDQIIDRRDPWHPVRLPDDYELHPDRREVGDGLRLSRTIAGQNGMMCDKNGPEKELSFLPGLTTTTLIGSDRNG